MPWSRVGAEKGCIPSKETWKSKAGMSTHKVKAIQSRYKTIVKLQFLTTAGFDLKNKTNNNNKKQPKASLQSLSMNLGDRGGNVVENQQICRKE